jgi:cytochrome c oxidase subunit II
MVMRIGKKEDMRRMNWVIASLVLLPAMAASFGQEAARTIQIQAKRFSFSPSEITLKKGETVKLELTSDDVPHSLSVPDLNINETITKGHTSEVTLTPQQAGDFQGRCGRFCGSGHGSMTIMVHVTDK